MAWLAVNRNGDETIFSICPTRYSGAFLCGIYPSVYLPKGSIHKLIGRTLTWEDEPVEIEDRVLNQCDGCRLGLPIKEGLHYKEGHPYICCTKHKYK